MGSEADVVEISSDEEEAAAEGERSAGWDPSGSPSIDWVDEFLEGVDGEELDDVVVLEEKSSKSCAAAEVRSPRGTGDDSDDDCMMLDGDPDGQMSAVDGDKSGVGDGSDELIIVGEKGQLACRDYPHPRHLCANFPFKTSPHEKYCDMCHCFVCDSPAPCQYWGNGISSTDHCHSTDKEARWKNERKSFKQRNMPTPNPSKLLNASPVMPPFLNPQLIPCNDPIIIPNPSSISNPLRSCPVTRSVPVPAVTSQKHHQRSLVASLRSQRIAGRTPKTPPLVPAMPRVQIERYKSGSIAAPIIHSHTKFKRIATPSTHPVHLNSSRCQTAVSSHNQTYRAAAPPRTQCPPVTSAEDGVKFWQDILAGVATELGVAEDTSRSTTVGQPYAVTSQSTLGLFHSQMTAETQDIGLANKSTPALTNTGQSCFDSSWLNVTTAQNNPDFEQLASKSNCSVFDSNIVSDVILDNFMGNVEQETVPEPVNKSGLLDMDPVSLLYDLDCSWST